MSVVFLNEFKQTRGRAFLSLDEQLRLADMNDVSISLGAQVSPERAERAINGTDDLIFYDNEFGYFGRG